MVRGASWAAVGPPGCPVRAAAYCPLASCWAHVLRAPCVGIVLPPPPPTPALPTLAPTGLLSPEAVDELAGVRQHVVGAVHEAEAATAAEAAVRAVRVPGVHGR